MKIAFDLRRIGNVGVGRYMTCLVNAITELAPQHNYLFIMAPGTEHLLRCRNGGETVVSPAAYYSIAEQAAIPKLLKKRKVDLFHALHFVVPLVKVCPTLVTLHDAIHFLYPQDLPSWGGRLYAKFMMIAAGHIADRIITVSDYSKRDLVRYLHVAPTKITTTYCLLDPRFAPVQDTALLAQIRKKLGVSENFLLYVGIFKERKNHIGLLNALAILRARGIRAPLVIAGPLGSGAERLRQKAVDLGIADDVVFAGLVSDEELPALYSAAKTYVCPSLYEGFGQTLVEAMACGTPVVSHNGTSLPEVCGDAALFADAKDPAEFAEQIQRSIEDANLRSLLIANGYKNVARFNAKSVADRTLCLYQELLGI